MRWEFWAIVEAWVDIQDHATTFDYGFVLTEGKELLEVAYVDHRTSIDSKAGQLP